MVTCYIVHVPLQWDSNPECKQTSHFPSYTLLGCVSSYLQMLRDKLLSATNYHHTPHNIPKELRPLHRGGRLKARSLVSLRSSGVARLLVPGPSNHYGCF